MHAQEAVSRRLNKMWCQALVRDMIGASLNGRSYVAHFGERLVLSLAACTGLMSHGYQQSALQTRVELQGWWYHTIIEMDSYSRCIRAKSPSPPRSAYFN